MPLSGPPDLGEVNASAILLKRTKLSQINGNVWWDLIRARKLLMRSEASLSKGLLFILTLVLKREGFFLFDLLQKLGEQRAIECHAFLRMLALVFTPLVQDQVPLLFGASMHLRVSIGNALKPLAVNVGVDHSHIVGFKTHRDGLTSNV